MAKKHWISATALAGMLVLGTACSRSGEEGSRERVREATPAAVTDTMAHVRMVDADSQNDELWFGTTKLFSGIEKNVISKYMDVTPERHEFQLRGTSLEKPLASNSEGLDAGKHYTVVAFEDMTKKSPEPTLRVVNDDTDAPKEGKAKVRIIHAAPGMEGIEVYASGRKDKLASESRFTTASSWQEVDPTDTNIEIRTTNDKEGIVRLPNFHLEAGKLYTFVVTGGEKNATRLRAVPIIDNPRRPRV